MKRSVAIMAAILMASGLVATNPQTGSVALASASCVIEPIADLTLGEDMNGRVYVGNDRVYAQEYQISADGSTTESVHYRMYSFNGAYIGTIRDFIIWWVDSYGNLWGNSTSDGSMATTPQWRSADGSASKDLQGTTYFLHEFGDYVWAFVETSFPTRESRFDVYDATGTFVRSVDALVASHHLERYGGIPDHMPLASGYGNVVAVNQKINSHGWFALYRPDGTKYMDLAPPPGGNDYGSGGALVTSEQVLVDGGLFTAAGDYLGRRMYRYSHSGGYLGEVEITGTTEHWGNGVMPDAGPPGVVVNGTAYWTAYQTNASNIVTGYLVHRIVGATATPLEGLSGGRIQGMYEVDGRLHVIENVGTTAMGNSVRSFDSSGDQLSTTPTGYIEGVYVSGGRALVDSAPSGTTTLEQVFEADGSLRGQLNNVLAGGHPAFSFRGDIIAAYDRILSGGVMESHLVLYDVTECPSPGDSYDGTFRDDDSSVFEADIEWMAAEGITKGCNPPVNDRFCPDGVVTRGQMAAFLTRALGLTERLDDPFVDDDDSVFEADIEKLAAAGITKGCNPPANDRFCPDGKVTREVMAAFLVRALGYTDNGGGDLFVDDDDSIFEADIDRLGTAGVTRGCNPPTNDRFCPKGNVTRGQMAAFLHRALG